MDKRLCATVPQEMDGRSVKDAARLLLSLSSTRLKKAKRVEGGVTVNGQPVFVTHILRAGDVLSILIQQEDAASETVVPVEGQMDIVYRDEWLMVLNKPANMPVHPSAGHYDDSLANLYAANVGGVFRPVNRLDAGTSGLMVAALDAHVHALLCKSLHTGDFERRYLAVTEGTPQPLRGAIDAPIARAEGSAIKRCVSQDGQRAVTHYRALRNNSRFCLVELILETGRTHQIRVHMQHIGHPLAGDFLYGTEDVSLIPRAALHACALRLKHPMTGEWIELTQELPEDMQKLTEGMTEI